jgi:pimeloyl-ACP methyl ester carboxylesterase
VTLVGHSLGGGIAMQFAYQFPERCERLVLVATGGLGPDVSPVLRAAALPGSELVLALIANRHLIEFGRSTGRRLRTVGIEFSPSTIETARGYGALAEPGIRRTFVQSLRAVVDHRGQRISTTGRLHVIDRIPTMLVWGGDDRVIPVDHAHRSHREMPGSRLEIFEHAGHFPHADEPHRFVKALHTFLAAPTTSATSCDRTDCGTSFMGSISKEDAP